GVECGLRLRLGHGAADFRKLTPQGFDRFFDGAWPAQRIDLIGNVVQEVLDAGEVDRRRSRAVACLVVQRLLARGNLRNRIIQAERWARDGRRPRGFAAWIRRLSVCDQGIGGPVERFGGIVELGYLPVMVGWGARLRALGDPVEAGGD